MDTFFARLHPFGDPATPMNCERGSLREEFLDVREKA
jgi:hypothetical protein